MFRDLVNDATAVGVTISVKDRVTSHKIYFHCSLTFYFKIMMVKVTKLLTVKEIMIMISYKYKFDFLQKIQQFFVFLRLSISI